MIILSNSIVVVAMVLLPMIKVCIPIHWKIILYMLDNILCMYYIISSIYIHTYIYIYIYTHTHTWNDKHVLYWVFCSAEDIFIMSKIWKFGEKIKHFLTLYYFVVVISSFLTVGFMEYSKYWIMGGRGERGGRKNLIINEWVRHNNGVVLKTGAGGNPLQSNFGATKDT